MFCYKVLSILVFACLVISLSAFFIGTLSREWWCGDFEAIVPFINNTKVPKGYQAHLLFDIRFGLYTVCWGLRQADTGRNTSSIGIGSIEECISELPDNPAVREIIKKNFEPFKNTLICLIVALIFNGLAFIFASIKLPCLKISHKKILLFTTVALATISAIASIAAVVISNRNMHYKAPFMRMILSKPPQLSDKLPPFAVKVLNRVFERVRIADLSSNFEKGVSFDITCVGVFFILVAVVLSLIEHCCAKKSGDDEYRSELISDGYTLPDKRDQEMNV